jgi:acyl-CoA reductase-like NAD-dependent aldehyde dehydrogenase
MWHAILALGKGALELLHILPRHEGDGNGRKLLAAEELDAVKQIVALQREEMAAMETRMTAKDKQIDVLEAEADRLRSERNELGHALNNEKGKVVFYQHAILVYGNDEVKQHVANIERKADLSKPAEGVQ